VNVELGLVAVVVAFMTGDRLVRLVQGTRPDMGGILAPVVGGVAALALDGGGPVANVIMTVAVGVVAKTVGVLFVPPGSPFGFRVLLTQSADLNGEP